MRRSALIMVVLLGHLAGPSARAASPNANDVAFFEKRIRPILVEHCYECHSADSKRLKGGLRLDTREAMHRGGDSGPALVPHDPSASLLLKALRYQDDLEMPPDGALPTNVIQDFESWIAAGAPDPRSETAPTDAPATPAEKAQLWSLQPLVRPDLPALKDPQWALQNPDRFIGAELERRGIEPVEDTDWPTLLRRLHFDLIGLPPTPTEIRQFLEAAAEDPERAIAHKVDALLASPRFGERWGRHWLDVARYAESNGQSRDVLFPHAWRYRNWVIEALNDDLPFDAFIHRQIAGDLLPESDPAAHRANRIATGFLAIGSKPLVGGNLPLDLVDDQIDAVSRSFLGLTVSCARCHDHKFDPIPTADYYALGGIFASTETLYGGGPKRPKTPKDAIKVWLTLSDNAGDNIKQLTALVDEKDNVTKKEKKAKNRLKRLRSNAKKNADAIRQLQAELSAMTTQHQDLDQALEAIRIEYAMGVRESKKPQDLAIRIRGEKNRTGEIVPRGFLSEVRIPSGPTVDRKTSGRRALAAWITHRDNPLTARVAVNRIWSHLFGKGLVSSVDNFGHSGSRPSHPALLDHLALKFMESGWSTKQMIKTLVTSRTYRLSSRSEAWAYSVDPTNTSLWRFNRRRLEVEPLHDALLSVGQSLDANQPKTSVVARIGEGEVGRGINTKPLKEPFRHRGVYLPVLRTALIDLHKTFDFPDPGNIQGQRENTNVPTQSLFLLNSPLVMEMAANLADHIGKRSQSQDARIREAYLWVFSRAPESTETQQAQAFLSTTGTQSESELWNQFCHALLASAEFRYLD